MDVKPRIVYLFSRLKKWLPKLSFRTGLYTLATCVLLYILSFTQMLLPISPWAKSVLWVLLFGLAKATQYSAILILGKAGISKIKKIIKSA